LANNEANRLPVITVKELDKIFEIALVLLGILAAAEFQYATALPVSNGVLELKQFTFRITTVPFVVLILGWIINELLVKIKSKQKTGLMLKLFCWNLWSFTLFVFLIMLIPFSIGTSQIASFQETLTYLIIIWVLSFVLIAIIGWVYGKLYSEQDNGFLSKTKWYTYVWVSGFISAFFAFMLIAFWALTAFG
jgi:hypothetical protein